MACDKIHLQVSEVTLFNSYDLSSGLSTIYNLCVHKISILLTETTASRNEVALIYHKVRGIYFLAVVFAATIF